VKEVNIIVILLKHFREKMDIQKNGLNLNEVIAL